MNAQSFLKCRLCSVLLLSANTWLASAAGDPDLISVDFIQSGGTTCSDDTTLTGTTMKNAVGNVFTGQAGSWNGLNIGTYNNNSAISGFLNDGDGSATTVKLALGLETGLASIPAGGWRCSPNEGALGGLDQLRSEQAYLYNGVITGDHFAWAFTGLEANTAYQLVFFGDPGATSGASNIANGVSGTLDAEGDWNWASVSSDASGKIIGTFTAPNPTLGLYGAQIYKLAVPPELTANAGLDKTVSPVSPIAIIGGIPAATGGTPPYSYSWSPATGLDDPNSPNPTASPTITTTYTLTVTDSSSPTPAQATDQVEVAFIVTPLEAHAGGDKLVSPGSPSVVIGGTPAASGGSTVYTYSWSPSTGLSATNIPNPTASPTLTTTYTLTVTDSLGTPEATDTMTVAYLIPNPNLISVDFIQIGGTTCSGDTLLTGTATMLNATGNIFTGQAGPWNPLNIGTYNNGSAISEFLNDGGGTTTTVKFAMGTATGLSDPGGWRCSPNEGATGGADKLRDEQAYLYNGVITGDHYAWALTGLAPNSSYKLTFFGDLGNASSASNIANGVSGTRDSEGDWDWESVISDGSGNITGIFTAPNPTLGIYGLQLELLAPPTSAYALWVASNGLTGGPGSPTDPAMAADPDKDGLSNEIEFVVGSSPTTGSPSPLTPATSGGDATFTFERTTVSKYAGVAVVIEVSTVLDNPTGWPQVFAVPNNSDSNFTISPNGATETVTLTVPIGADPAKFARMKVLISE